MSSGARGALGGAARRFRQVHGRERLGRLAAREVDELVDDRVHVVEVLDHRALRRRVDPRLQHLGLQAQPRERRAQVVRDPGEERRALALLLLQVVLHLVEGARDGADLRRPGLRNRLGIAALAELLGGTRELRERAVQLPDDEEGGGERDRQARRAPRDDRRCRFALDAPARERDPELARAGGDPDPQRLARALRIGAVGGAAHVDVGFGPEDRAHALAEMAHDRRVERRAHVLVAAHRQDADAFLLGDARDERLLLLRIHRRERGVDRLQVAHELADAEGDARLRHELVQQPQRRRLREHERRHEHGERAPQQRPGEELHGFCGAPSGMNT
jgi:hypothetical protein